MHAKSSKSIFIHLAPYGLVQVTSRQASGQLHRYLIGVACCWEQELPSTIRFDGSDGT
uniref:Uncharacterized protein n=1 Tax=Arundo donax TaxID=35708 RepID=A0A0A9AUK4_ARUDO